MRCVCNNTADSKLQDHWIRWVKVFKNGPSKFVEDERDLKSRKRKTSEKRVVGQGYRINYKKKGSNEKEDYKKELGKFHLSFRRTITMCIIYLVVWPNKNLHIKKGTYICTRCKLDNGMPKKFS